MKTFGALSNRLKELFSEFKPELNVDGYVEDEDRENWIYLEIGIGVNYFKIFDPLHRIPISEGNIVVEFINENMFTYFTGEVALSDLESTEFIKFIQKVLLMAEEKEKGSPIFAEVFTSFKERFAKEEYVEYDYF